MEVTIKFRGGKNLSKIDWRDAGYMREVLPWAGRQIRNRVLQRGTTADGRPLPGYSKRYQRQLTTEGRSKSRVDYQRTGQMWASLNSKVNSKGQGEVGFSGSHKDTIGRRVNVRRKLKSGKTSSRTMTNQMLASILAFRQPGRRTPDHPLGYHPPFSFMMLDPQSEQQAVLKYSKYWKQKVASAPPAL